MRITSLLLAVTAFALAAAPARGQDLDAGTRVRVTTPIAGGDARFVGTVLSTEHGRVLLRLDPALRTGTRDTLSIPRSLIRRVEVSMGTARRQATRTGAIAGLAAGLGIGIIAGSGTRPDGSARNPLVTALWVAPAMGMAGAGAGALLSGNSPEQWRTVGLAPGFALGKRMSVSIRLGF